MKRRPRWRPILVALTLRPARSSPAAGRARRRLQCKVDYTTNDWGSGFTANSRSPTSARAIDGWTLTYSYAGNQTLQSGWNGTWSQSGKDVTVKTLSWNGTIATGAQRHHRRATSPTAAPTPRRPRSPSTARPAAARTSRRPPSLTSPAAGATYTAGDAIPLAATAAAADGATISQGRVLQRHHAARHRHHRAVHLRLGARPGRCTTRSTPRRTTAWARPRSPRRSASRSPTRPGDRRLARPSSAVQQGKTGHVRA